MRRLYYLADNLHTCERVAAELAEAGIGNWHFHVLSRDEIGLYQHRVHAAATYHRFDVIASSERWALGGALIGLLVGVIVYLGQLLPWPVSPASVLLMTVVGALLGAWPGALRGLGQLNYKIRHFQDEIDAGRHLLMVDVNERNRARVRELMNVRFPSVEFRGRDTPYLTPFPQAKPF